MGDCPDTASVLGRYCVPGSLGGALFVIQPLPHIRIFLFFSSAATGDEGNRICCPSRNVVWLFLQQWLLLPSSRPAPPGRLSLTSHPTPTLPYSTQCSLQRRAFEWVQIPSYQPTLSLSSLFKILFEFSPVCMIPGVCPQ